MTNGQGPSWGGTPSQAGPKLYRSRTNRMLAGVCGGLAELTGVDASLIRLGWLFLILFGGAGLIAYLVMALVIPERPAGEEKVIDIGAGATRSPSALGRNTGIVIGVVIVFFGLLLFVNALGWLPISLGALWRLFWRIFWPVVLISLGALILVGAFWGDREWWRNMRAPAPGRSLVRPRSSRMVAGVCAGLANYFQIDPSLVRIVWALAALSTAGMALLVYVLAVLLIPEE